jgi:hypothetical protein
MESIGAEYGVSKSRVYETIQWLEDTLTKDKAFKEGPDTIHYVVFWQKKGSYRLLSIRVIPDSHIVYSRSTLHYRIYVLYLFANPVKYVIQSY